MQRIRTVILIVLSMFMLRSSVAAQSVQGSTAGSLCVLPHVREADALRRSPQVPPAAEAYSLRLDNGSWVALSPELTVLLAGIPVTRTHRVSIRGDGKPFSAFTFTFDQLHVTNACLVQSDMYLVWQFHPATRSYRACQCVGVDPADWMATRQH